jgi:hypothetical protein
MEEETSPREAIILKTENEVNSLLEVVNAERTAIFHQQQLLEQERAEFRSLLLQ